MSKIQLKSNKHTGIASYKLIFKKALPVIISLFFSNMVPMADNIMVGMINDQALGALGFSGTLLFVNRIMLMGLAGGAGVMIGQYLGSGQLEKVRETHRLKLNFAIGLAIPFILWMAIIPESYMRMFTNYKPVVEYGSQYLRIMSASIVLAGLAGQMGGSTAQLGHSSLFMIVSLCGVGGNIFLDYAFVEWAGWGIKGIAWATVMVQGAMVFAIYLYNWITQSPIHTDLMHLFKIRREVIVKTFKRWHMFVTEVIFTLSIMLGGILLAQGYLETNGEIGAVQGATGPITRLAMAGFIGSSSTISFIVGTRLGADDFESAKTNARRILLVGVGTGVLLGALVSGLADYILLIYPHMGDSTRKNSVTYLRFVPIVTALIAISAMQSRIVEVGGDTKSVMYWDFIYNILYIGLTALIAFVIHPKEIWLAILLVNFIRFLKVCYTTYLYKRGKWLQNLTLIKKKEEDGIEEVHE